MYFFGDLMELFSCKTSFHREGWLNSMWLGGGVLTDRLHSRVCRVCTACSILCRGHLRFHFRVNVLAICLYRGGACSKNMSLSKLTGLPLWSPLGTHLIWDHLVWSKSISFQATFPSDTWAMALFLPFCRPGILGSREEGRLEFSSGKKCYCLMKYMSDEVKTRAQSFM